MFADLNLLAALSLAVLACTGPASFRVASDREDMGLKGPVKSVREKWVGAPRGKPKTPDDGWVFDTLTTFDREGRRLEEARFDPEGKSWGRSVFSYQDGWSTETLYHADGSVFQRLIIKEQFDKASGTIKTKVTVTMGEYEGAPYSETIERRGAREWQADSSYFLPDGKLTGRSTTRFGADGEMDELLTYSAEGAIVERHVRVKGGGGFTSTTRAAPSCKRPCCGMRPAPSPTRTATASARPRSEPSRSPAARSSR